jgi:predicted metal-dependent phosphoesterase TrpH
MNMPYADLHCHSTYSDGSATPEQLVQLAIQKGLKALAITDHDNIEAFAAAQPYAAEAGLTLISGVEFSCEHKHKSVHILGYGLECSNSELINFCLRHRMRRITRFRKILELLTQAGMPITEEELQTFIQGDIRMENRSIGRPHIAMCMVKKGYVSSIQEAFNLFLGDGKPFYVPQETFSPLETIDIIHKAQGVAVIAHPHLIKNSPLLLELLLMPFDGIECFYGTFPKNACARWSKIAERKHWLMTGGSDYHGDAKPFQQLGSNGMSEDQFRLLQTTIQNMYG